MKKKVLAVVLGMAMTIGMSAAGVYAEEAATSTYGNVVAKEKYSFELIVKNYSSDFWQATVQGIEDEAALLGVEVNCTGPNSASDIADQVTVDLLVMIANGEEVEDVSTPAYWYDADNMNDEEIAPNLIK